MGDTRGIDIGARFLLALVLAVYLVVLIRTAWLHDEAYATFRTVENLLSGEGLVWNPGERVQTFIHPLWLFLMAGLHGVTGGEYLTTVLFSMLLSAVAVVFFLFLTPRRPWLAVPAGLAVLFSSAFVDYSTSGLETPLTHLLLIGFLILFSRTCWGTGHLLAMSAFAGLAAFNRLDTLLLFGPPLLYVLLSFPPRKSVPRLIAGFAPCLLWCLFALVYYGFVLPNPVHARNHADILPGQWWADATAYFAHAARHDPITLIAIGLALVAALLHRDARSHVLGLGLALYLGFIVLRGGDGLAGRLLSAPFLLSLAMLVRLPLRPGTVSGLTVSAVVVLAGLWAPHPPVLTGSGYGRLPGAGAKGAVKDGRRQYFQATGLLQWSRRNHLPIHPDVGRGRRLRSTRAVEVIYQKGSAGILGYFAGAGAVLVDRTGAKDPLLARLPATYMPDASLNAPLRAVPLGYRRVMKGSKDGWKDTLAQDMYQALHKVTAGPIWDGERWQAIWDLHTNRYFRRLDVFNYRFPNATVVSRDEVRKDRGRPLKTNGLCITFDGRIHRSLISFLFDAPAPLHAAYLQDGRVIAARDANRPGKGGQPRPNISLQTPLGAIRQGYDALCLFPLREKPPAKLLHVRLR